MFSTLLVPQTGNRSARMKEKPLFNDVKASEKNVNRELIKSQLASERKAKKSLEISQYGTTVQ
jgi:hypothetical protein